MSTLLCNPLSKHPELSWREGIATRLEWADDKLWLVFEPRTLMDGLTAR